VPGVSGRRVVVTGAGALSPVADSPAGLHEALCRGESGLKPIELFSTEGLGCHQAGEIRPFEPRGYLGERNLRPVDRTCRLLLVAAQQALESSGWTPELRAEREVGLVLGTMFCSVRTIAEFDRRALQLGPSYASPMDFANSVINAAAGQTAIWHDLRGVNSTVSAGEASGLAALGLAAGLIRDGRAEALLAGGAEELCFESFLGFYRAGRLCGSAGDGGGDFPIPFDARRNGFAAAEGAALLVLEDAESAAARGAAVHAEILGQASTFAPSPEAAGRALARAVRQALEEAGVEPGDLDFVSAGADGSLEGDRAEALGLAESLGGRAATVPVTAVKALLGEALGASGGFQAVAALGTLADGRLPGIPGFERGEEGFPLGGVAGTSGGEGRTVEARRALLTAVGADGHCAAVVLSAGTSGAGRGPA
jgi:3-oxoacyl-[acyl-carrier-protein] synthase II